MSISLFNDEKTESSVQIIRETMNVSLDDNGTPIVSFATNRGKGSGAQSMAVSDFADYIEALEEVASNGIEERAEDALSPADTVRRTITNVDGVVHFRVRSGKGAKPAKVSMTEFAEVTELLRDTVEAVEAAAERLG
jgi:hypothetical protein